MLEFLRKQDNFRIEKVYPFRVVFPPFGEIVSHLFDAFTLNLERLN